MRKLEEKLRDLSIGKKIIFYTYIVMIPILVLICIVVTGYRYYINQQEYLVQQKAGMNNLALSLNIVEEDVRYLSLNLAINQEIQAVLTAENAEALNYDAQLWQHRTPVQTIEDTMALKGYINTLSIYTENGVFPYLRCIDSSSSYISDLDELHASSAYQKAVELQGKGLWVSAAKGSGEIYQANRSEKLVLCRAIFNQSRSRLLGYLTIGISQETVEKLCRSVLESDEDGVILLDKSGNEIISYGYVDDEIRQYLQEQHLTTAADYHGTSGKWEIYTGPISDSGWHVCKITPKQGLFDLFREVVYIPLLLLLGMVLGIWPIIRAMSKRISQPLQTVCEAMVQFRQGDFEQQVEIQTKDEVGQVAACFNQMVTDIRELINKNYILVLKERESELAILQAQINPHFLYNALDSIYWQATGEGDEATAESIYELAQLFRLVLGQGKRRVTVEMEMALLERYLEIQKLRFQKQLEYHIDTEPAARHEMIPKLILEPFVENSVIHGMQNGEAEFMLTVTARMDGEYLEFLIRDTGVGMNEAQLRSIWEKDQDKAFTGQKIGRYGIRNVKERLELEYGEKALLKIESCVGEGTLITIRIPALRPEEDSAGQEQNEAEERNAAGQEQNEVQQERNAAGQE